MTRRAVIVDAHLTVLSQNPDVQDEIGEKLAAQGIGRFRCLRAHAPMCADSAWDSRCAAASFGEPLHVDSYPTLKLNWYRTRRVVKWSRVVREEKAAQHYGITALPAPSVRQSRSSSFPLFGFATDD